MTEAEKIRVELTADEALVLCDWLFRCGRDPQSSQEDCATQAPRVDPCSLRRPSSKERVEIPSHRPIFVDRAARNEGVEIPSHHDAARYSRTIRQSFSHPVPTPAELLITVRDLRGH